GPRPREVAAACKRGDPVRGPIEGRQPEGSLGRRGFSTVAATLAAALFVTSVPMGAAQAGLVTTEQMVEERAAASERERLATVLLRDDVRQQMEALGVDQEEAMARLASLSDQEVQQIAGQLDERSEEHTSELQSR